MSNGRSDPKFEDWLALQIELCRDLLTFYSVVRQCADYGYKPQLTYARVK